MACRVVGAKPLSEPMLELGPWDNNSVKSYLKSYIFFQDNASENVVWEVAAILPRPQCVN